MASKTIEKKPFFNLKGTRASARGFVHWWVSELSFLVPQKCLSFLNRKQQPTVVMQYQQSQIEVYHLYDKGCDYIGAMTVHNGEIENIESGLKNWFQETGIHLRPVITLPENRVVRKDIVLPKVAVNNLDNVLKYELDRHTPFKSDQAYYDYVFENTSASDELVNVAIYAVAKSLVNDLLDALQPIGLNQAQIVTGANLKLADPLSNAVKIRLDHDVPLSSEKNSSKLQMAMSFVLIALTLTVLIVPIIKMEAVVSDLREQLRVARKEVDVINKTRSDINLYIKKLEALKENKVTASNVVDVMLELTTVLPDDTWVENFAMKDGRITIQGQSISASELIKLLESSEYFAKAKFESPVLQNRDGTSERFNIMAEIVKGQTRVN
ncbi:PilN domain-containing protein [Kaarinaea lacus]